MISTLLTKLYCTVLLLRVRQKKFALSFTLFTNQHCCHVASKKHHHVQKFHQQRSKLCVFIAISCFSVCIIDCIFSSFHFQGYSLSQFCIGKTECVFVSVEEVQQERVIYIYIYIYGDRPTIVDLHRRHHHQHQQQQKNYVRQH